MFWQQQDSVYYICILYGCDDFYVSSGCFLSRLLILLNDSQFGQYDFERENKRKFKQNIILP